ncbi:hypothetical protein QR680_013944 [Steinernema hermaphroditum]|uniref:Uncharacterized protein n=1 Tax=Steinernema hermaphroditum TaxID=289476 RepID=A0AA39I9Y3_9BILA|nr:hypothetical protein QR680_013944 [Steinernema hermaphroditum]
MLVAGIVFVFGVFSCIHSAPLNLSPDALEVLKIALEEWSEGNHPFLSERLQSLIRAKCPRFFPVFYHDTFQIRILKEKFPPVLNDLIASYQVQQVMAMTGKYTERAKAVVKKQIMAALDKMTYEDKKAFGTYYSMITALEKKYSKGVEGCPMISESLK